MTRHLSDSSSRADLGDGAGTRVPVKFIDLGRMRYAEALECQRREQSRLIAARGGGDAASMTVYFVEHDPPVITVSRRPGAAAHLLAGPERLRRLGVEVETTDRGGDITWHGPGQLVVYPILDLDRLGLRIHSYMRFLESVVIDVLSRAGIAGHRDACATGVWVGGATVEPDAPGGCDDSGTTAGGAKICAMGVRVSRWVSMHGLALNVRSDLAAFDLIVPCGLAGRPVTSMEAELGRHCPSMTEMKVAMRQAFEEAIARQMSGGRVAGP